MLKFYSSCGNYRILLQASPLYIAEIAPKEKRGIMTAFVNGFSTTGGVVRMSFKGSSFADNRLITKIKPTLYRVNGEHLRN